MSLNLAQPIYHQNMRKIAQLCGIPALILLSWGAHLNLLFLKPLAAQNLPNPNPNFLPLDSPTPLPPPEELLTPPSPQTPPRETLPPDSLTVTRYEVRGSTVFSEEQLQAITAPFTGEGVTFDQLVAARSAVEQMYLEHQYLTSGADLPLQTIQGGVVIIQVVEGRIAEIEMKGLKRLPEQYIRRRLPNAQRVPLHLSRLEEEIQLLQQNPLIERISANLMQGENPGENVLEVTVTEASPWQVQVGVTNDRVPTVGTVEGYGMMSWGNVGGWGDRLGGSYRRSEGSEGWEVSYLLPLNAREGTLGLRYNLTNHVFLKAPILEDGDEKKNSM
ncbi:hypothetical protein K4A83_21040 [Spirulina subsalsa FACHB-351]|uniref:Polypeptide-transport-associated ShlB-type domain-containing protein n=1 Tax=Spirulina subsalsa FACHB-351 TaxID=234711 RepID=A0ABT3LB46_9CYAN|nr:POTRA domain-containing protein [Spirulina subsalsa]MCW6038738.1 hypothetical protein [Spirulina subsalsa FACHB-351]